VQPFGLIGGLARDLAQRRRKVRLTVHRAFIGGPFMGWGGPAVALPDEEYLFVTVTNTSEDRDVVITDIWFATTPPVHVSDPGLPVRLGCSDRWETSASVKSVPDGTANVEFLARCRVSPDDKVVKSRPRQNMPPFGTVPRGGTHA
jgi:hypothetical protein